VQDKIRIITTDEVCKRLEVQGSLLFWNVLTDEYFQGELIPGSKRVPLDQLEREVVQSGVLKDAEIITYCSGPSCPMSKQAAEKLVLLGFTNVKAYEGGLEEWKKARQEVVSIELAPAVQR
jgi:rhodanese-related sulfurtransferase